MKGRIEELLGGFGIKATDESVESLRSARARDLFALSGEGRGRAVTIFSARCAGV